MSIQYTVDVLAELKKKGYSAYKLTKEKILGNGSIQKIRDGAIVSIDSLDKICKILECQPGDIIARIED